MSKMEKEEKNYNIGGIYRGSYSSLDPNYGEFVGYRSSARTLGLTTDARTANVIQEVSNKLSTGATHLEVGSISEDVFESIPKGHLTEVNRLSKVTGIDVSLHAPVIEPSGITQQGFSELDREMVERQMKLAIEKGHELKPDKGIPITFHSSAGIPGTQYKMTPEGKKIERLMVINQETGRIGGLAEDEKYLPGTNLEKAQLISATKDLSQVNDSDWKNNIAQMEYSAEQANLMLSRSIVPLMPLITEYKEGDTIKLDPIQKNALQEVERAGIFLDNIESNFNVIFNRAYKYSNENEKEKLRKISEEWANKLKEMQSQDVSNQIISRTKIIKQRADLLNDAISQIITVEAPKLYVPVEEFAINQSAKTFANVAFDAYKKYGSKAPIISIENPPAGGAFSTGEELKNLVEKTKEEFINSAVKKGIDRETAIDQANKMIGVTWDVGHINMLRKMGYSSKDIVKETEKVAPLVKHMHLSDNFGMEHTELPMGMGNVPFKEIMEKFGKEGFQGKKIIEAIQWWQHFKSPPFQASLEAMGSPVYGAFGGPYWNQLSGFSAGYYSGLGPTLPQGNYETFGAGFSQLPTDLGGQRPGAQGSRVSGRPME